MTTIEMCLLSASGLLTSSAFVLYLNGALRCAVRPNRWSWLIWTLSACAEALTFQAVSTDALTAAVFWFSVVGCFALTVVAWTSSAWRTPTWTELLCAAVAIAGLALALAFEQAWWGHLLVVIIIPVSFIPTYVDARRDYRQEESHSWLLWMSGDLLALSYVLVRLKSAQEIPYAAVEALCHGTVWLIVVIARRKRKALSGPSALPGSAIKVDMNHLGEAVFAARAFRAGDFIFSIKGELISSYDLPNSYEGPSDRFMQVDHDLFIGPSGDADDLVNHSCDPNAGIRFTQYGIILVALRDILPGEEICWDYSTTMLGIDWSMQCDCRSSSCRAIIGGFSSLPAERRAYYLEERVVAPFIERWEVVKQPSRVERREPAEPVRSLLAS